mmetsp:Transcript_60950/g.149240  ORF Transcript_60950/g.149240 Transcript_60950/m.149240 type:complete len:466 (+) Transcript_60950:234-1631(+)
MMTQLPLQNNNGGDHTKIKRGGGGALRAIAEKPRWLQAIYLLFVGVCLNAILTYNREKQLALLAGEEAAATASSITHDNDNGLGGIQYSAGAEEHVVSSSYGSSMYGGSIHTHRDKKSKIKGSSSTSKKQPKIEPVPDGTKDLALKLSKKSGGSTTDMSGFRIFAMSDTPMIDWQEKRLRDQMAQIRDHLKENPDHNVAFGVHLGNTQKVSNYLCTNSTYQNASYLLGKAPRPTLVVPGKEDWFECPRREESFELFMEYFGSSFIPKYWHQEHYEPLQIERSEDHPELFVLHTEGILFIGVHLLNAESGQESKSTWDERMLMNRQWVASSVETYLPKYETRGVIIMGNSPMTDRTRPFFTTVKDYFANVTSRETLPVVYLHGDGKTWQVDRTFSVESGWESFWDVQLDQSGLADPVWLDVAPQLNGKLQPLEQENDMQIVLGDGLFRIDRRGGRYANPMDILEHT